MSIGQMGLLHDLQRFPITTCTLQRDPLLPLGADGQKKTGIGQKKGWKQHASLLAPATSSAGSLVADVRGHVWFRDADPISLSVSWPAVQRLGMTASF